MQSLCFPSFRTRFIQEAAWAKDTCAQEALPASPGEGSSEPLVRMAGCGPAAAVRGPSNFIRPLMLDLNTLPREDGPPSESVLKRQKFAVFEKHCSQVADGLFVSGEAVARDRSILAQHSISHVVNCVGALYPEYFKADGIQYKTLWLQDHPQEDITCVLYDTFDFIEAARKGSSSSPGATSRQAHQQQPQQPQQQHFGNKVPPLPLQQQQSQSSQRQHLQQQQQSGGGSSSSGGGGGGGGRVLVHCSQGVSRSTTIAIAYLMWKTGGSYDEVYQAVRALRGVTSPNVGFMCQLINWAKRRQRPPSRCRLYRISPHCPEAPLYLVPRAVGPRPGCSSPDWTQLDPRGCFVAHLQDKVYVWRGLSCTHSMLEAGLQAAARLARYEGAPPALVVRQGEEPADLLAALTAGRAPGGSSACGTSSCCTRADSAATSGEPSSNNLVGAAAAAAAPAGPVAGELQAAAAARGWGGSSSRQQQQQPGQQRQQRQQDEGDGDTEMTSASPSSSAAGTCPSSAQQQRQQQEAQPCGPQHAAPASSQEQHSSSQPSAAAAAAAAGGGGGTAPPDGSGTSASDAAAAAAAAQVLLGVQLGPAGGLQALQQVQEYDTDYELWSAALHRSSQQLEGAGRSTPRSPLAVASGLAVAVADEGVGLSPRTGQSPASSCEGRGWKFSRSDSEGRSVVPSCRQPGRLSTSSSQAWPDGGVLSGAGAGPHAAAAAAGGAAGVPVSLSEGGAYVAAAAGQALARAGMREEVDWAPAAAAGVVEMRQSSTNDGCM